MKPFLHCSFCGTKFPVGTVWPKTCTQCTKTTWRNPLPVAVLLVPHKGALIGVSRKLPDGYALPGGFVNLGETWQEAAAREMHEETNVSIDPQRIKLFDVVSAPDGTLLIFGSAPEVRQLPEFTPNEEVSERILIDKFTALVFPIHHVVVHRYFERNLLHEV